MSVPSGRWGEAGMQQGRAASRNQPDQSIAPHETVAVQQICRAFALTNPYVRVVSDRSTQPNVGTSRVALGTFCIVLKMG